MHRRSLGVLVGTCLLLSAGVLAAPAAGASGTDGADRVAVDSDGQRPLSTQDATIELVQTLELVPEEAGTYGVHHRYDIPDEVRSLEVTLPAEATVTATRGFGRSGDRSFEWDGETPGPTLEYRMPGNRTIDRSGPIGGPGTLLFVDVGEWGLVSRPPVSHSWESVGGAEFVTTRRAERGAVGDRIAFLGPHEEFTHTAHGQRFRLIVPEQAALAEEPRELFAALGEAADRLRVGDRDREVFLVAAPTAKVDWGVRGLQTGPADVWVRDVERLDRPENVWVHEYVHTRQGYDADRSLRWFTEGTAVYYAALVALEADRIEFDAFRDRLRAGTDSRFSEAVLSRPSTWNGAANYHVGGLVAGDLDRRIRLATDSGATFQEVFRRLNDRGDADADAFQAALRRTAGDGVAATGERHTTTTDRPSVWTADQHGEAFGALPARITYALPADGTDARATGPYRDAAVEADGLVLVPDETLTLTATATNDGGRPGEYEAVFRVNGEVRTNRTGRLDPGESVDLPLEHTFDSTGEFTLSVGEATLPVTVREPARARVTAFSANRTELEPGGGLELSVTVANDADRPGRLELPFTRDGDRFETATVRLDGNAETTVTVAVWLSNPGTTRFGLGDASPATVDVTVAEPTDAATPTPTPGSTPSPAPDADGTGFGAAGALLAVAALLLIRS